MEEETWWTVEQVAEYFQVREEAVRRWIRAGDLPALDLGGRKLGYRVKQADVATFVEERYGAAEKKDAA